MKLSASLYSGDRSRLSELVTELDELGIDCFHIDCNDDPLVFEDIRTIRSMSGTPIDLHIISPEPEKYIDAIVSAAVEYVCFQYEPAPRLIRMPDFFQGQRGIAITTDTALEAISSLVPEHDFVLFMTTTPGKSGGVFDTRNFARIRTFSRQFPGTAIHVDGGINHELSFILRNMGTDLLVSGSYLMKAGSKGAALVSMRRESVHSSFFMRDIMMLPEELPVLEKGQFSLQDLLQRIQDFKMGFAVITRNGKLHGVVGNSEIRKGLLRHIHNLNAVQPDELVNITPVTIEAGETVSGMIEKIKSLPFPVLYLPVVSSDGSFCGAILLNQLIKGES